MTQDKTFLGTEPIGKLLVKLAVPTVVAQLVNMLYNIVDRIYIGHMPGDGSLALTGVGVCLPLIMIISAFAALVASGGAPRASIAMGKGDHGLAEKLLGGCFTLQIVISAILTAVMLIFSRDLLLMFGASENTIGYAADYMRIYAIGTLFVQLTLGMNAFITAQGFATTGMLTVLIGAVANIALDPLFIYGLGMGVRGAALATVISQGLSCVWVICFLRGKKTLLRLKRENLLVSPKLILPCVALGLAAFIMQSSESMISVCFNSSLLRYGGRGRGRDDHPVQRDAVCHAAAAGHCAGRAAHQQLQLRRAQHRSRAADLPAAIAGMPGVLHGAVGGHYAVPARVCGHFYPGCGAAGFHRPRAAHLLRDAVPVRHSDCLPDDLCIHRQRALLHSGGGAAQVCAAAAADLPAAQPAA